MKNLKRILSFFIVMGFMFVMLGFRLGVKATDQTWDLATATYASASDNEVSWTSTYVNMKLEKNTSQTKASNYLGGSGNYDHTRVYQNQKITFEMASGYQIDSIKIVATSTDYASKFKNSTWTNGTASTSSTNVTVVPTTKTSPVSVVITAATRATSVTVSYSAAARYDVIFDTNGGIGSFGPYNDVLSGSKIADPGDPTREGYLFAGWYNGLTQWDFDNDTVTASITLTAKWSSNAAQTAINNALEDTNAYLSLAYGYTLNKVDNPTTYTQATFRSHLSAGDSVIIVGKDASGNYFALSNSISNSQAAAVSINIEDGVITSEIDSSFVWQLGGTQAGWTLQNGTKYISTSSNTNITTTTSNPPTYTFVADGNNSYFLNGTRTVMFRNYNSTDMFKNYITTSIGDTAQGYAAEMYVYVKQATAKYTVRDVDFRIRCAIDEGLAELNEDYSVTFGIEVTAGGKTVRYSNSDGASFQTSGGKQFVTLDLGDMLNTNYANLDTEFTVKAFVEHNGVYYYSTNAKTYSVKGMVNQYYNVEHIDAVEGLKEILESYGYTFE